MIKVPKPDPIDHGNPALCMARRNKGATTWAAGCGAILALLALGNTAPAAGDRQAPNILQLVESPSHCFACKCPLWYLTRTMAECSVGLTSTFDPPYKT
jgi:hypothetical protein